VFNDRPAVYPSRFNNARKHFATAQHAKVFSPNAKQIQVIRKFKTIANTACFNTRRANPTDRMRGIVKKKKTNQIKETKEKRVEIL
jgi:hypothetical protein